MSDRRPPKKSETVEVRLAHEVKQALMRKARAEGRSASDVIRESIDFYLSGKDKEKASMIVPIWKAAIAAGAFAGAALVSVMASAPVTAGPDFKAAFEHLDTNHDQQISLAEFIGRNEDMTF